jgi:histidinol-phosphate aminotransferase
MKTITQVLALARPSLLSLKPYSSARDEFDQSASGIGNLVFLDANENPYASPHNRYPDPHQRELKNVLSSIKGRPAEEIFIGNGSDEAIDLILRAFCAPGYHSVVIPSPTYGMYSVSAAINEVLVKPVFLSEKFDLDPATVLDTVDDRTRIVFLCTPNNPTGNNLSRDALMRVVKGFNGLVVVDEAYIDFTSFPSLLSELEDYPNLIVLQTLSKAWGLAGLRLGMAFAHRDIISLLDKIKPPYNISSYAQQTAIEVLKKSSEKEKRVSEILAERARVAQALSGMKSVQKVYPSEANFILVRVSDAPRAYNYLVRAGIVVRDRSQVRLCEQCLRITIGTAIENDLLLKALAAYE